MNSICFSHKKHKVPDGIAEVLGGSNRATAVFAAATSLFVILAGNPSAPSALSTTFVANPFLSA